MELEEDDVFDVMLDKIIEERNKIKDQLDKENTGYTFKKGCTKSTQSGDMRHHSGIDIITNQGNQYYIGFTGLNFDYSTGNFHSCIGRIQFIIGDGNPNKSVKVGNNTYYDINYPKMGDTSLKDGKKIKDNQKVYHTGYRIFGNRKTTDILLTDNNIGDFVKLIIDTINGLENKA